MTTTKRQTAGNNAELARVKKHMNAAVYKATLAVYNDEGREAARAYLGRFFHEAAREGCLKAIFDGE